MPTRRESSANEKVVPSLEIAVSEIAASSDIVLATADAAFFGIMNVEDEPVGYPGTDGREEKHDDVSASSKRYSLRLAHGRRVMG